MSGGPDPRFGGIRRLFAPDGQARLWTAHVAVIGLGGVGSWAAEALARSGVGRITLVDEDVVSITNTNRQLHALATTIGRPKAEVMAERLKEISPEARIDGVRARFEETTAGNLLRPDFNAVIDAIDQPAHKALLIAACHSRRFPVVTSGGAAGRRDPGLVRVTDLALASHDRLLAVVRCLLRRHHRFPRGDTPWGVDCVFSPETAVRLSASAPAGPDCRHGMGTVTFVTGTFGFTLAGLVVRRLAQGTAPP